MNTPINFELAKLLKEKGFNLTTNKMYCKSIPMFEHQHNVKFHDGNKHECCNEPYDWNSVKSQVGSTTYYSAPTIADVIMWLYENYNQWVVVKTYLGQWQFELHKAPNPLSSTTPIHSAALHKTPTAAYEEAIQYVLTNLI
jgi:hypothetical protein